MPLSYTRLLALEANLGFPPKAFGITTKQTNAIFANNLNNNNSL